MSRKSASFPLRHILLMVVVLLFFVTSLMGPGAHSAATYLGEPATAAPPAVPGAPVDSHSQTASSTQPAQTPPVLPLKGKKIVLDPGHGGSDPGATRENIQESDLTLGIALKLKKILEAQGAVVVLTRCDDSDVELEDRTALSNKEKPNIFVSIHINSCNNPDADGIETYYYTDGSERLAQCLFDNLVAALGAKANWVHQRRLYVCTYTDAPSTLVEVGYISNKVKRDKMATDDYQELIAQALATGIDKYFAPKPPANKRSPATPGKTAIPAVSTALAALSAPVDPAIPVAPAAPATRATPASSATPATPGKPASADTPHH